MKNGRYKEGSAIVWYLDDLWHRDDDLPAIEWFNSDGSSDQKHWYQHGMLHRTTGPAHETANGHKSWWLNNELLDCKTQEEFEHLMRLKAFW